MRARTGLAVGIALALTTGTAAAAPPNTGDFKTPFTTSLISSTTSPPNRSVGRLASRFPDGSTLNCSASVVDAANQSTLLTAGHCVKTVSRGGLATSATFTPAYQGGQAPYGSWASLRIVPSGPWMLTGHSHFDFAFVVLRPSGKARRHVEDVVGGLPIGFNQPRDQAYHLLGYPGVPNPPYDGQQLWACDSTYGGDIYDPDPDEQYGPPIMYTGCSFDHGASGGPWLNPQGVVSSVISTTLGSTTPNIVGGPYLGPDAAALFASVTGTAPIRGCKKRKGKRRGRVAVAARKGCKRHKRR